jgi:hypothetical protein
MTDETKPAMSGPSSLGRRPKGGTAILEPPRLEVPEPLPPVEGLAVAAPVPRVGAPAVPARARTAAKPFWVGTLPESPLFNWTAPGGVRFVRESERLEGGVRHKTKGQVVRLDEVQLARLLAGVQQHVIRNAKSMTGQARVWCVDDIAYRADPSDVPIGSFLYCYPLDPDNIHNRPTLSPRPLYTEG